MLEVKNENLAKSVIDNDKLWVFCEISEVFFVKNYGFFGFFPSKCEYDQRYVIIF